MVSATLRGPGYPNIQRNAKLYKLKIGIFGDSWAYSSYKKQADFQETVDNLTFKDFFDSIGIQSTNYAIPGGTNLDTLIEIQKHYADNDLLLVFQTDPIRQCVDEDSLRVHDNLILPSAANFSIMCENILGNWYAQLGAIARPMLLIGGCTKLCHYKVPAHIMTSDQSWSELVSNGFQDNYFYWTEPTLVLYQHVRKLLGWSIDDFFEIEKQIKQKNYLWQTSDMFSWCHAAQPAYRLMFKKIERMLYECKTTTPAHGVLWQP